MTNTDSNKDTRTLEGARYVLTVENKTNRLYGKGSLVAGTEVMCLRKQESGYYVPCVAFIVEAKSSGRITVDLYTDRSERVTVSAKAILWPTDPQVCEWHGTACEGWFEKIAVTNPYPEHQGLAGEMNCWNCFKLLWHRADTLKHLCNDCQQTHIAVENCLGCGQNPCQCADEIAKASLHDCGQRRKAQVQTEGWPDSEVG